MATASLFPTGNATQVGVWTNGATALNADDGTNASFTTTTKNDVRSLTVGGFGFDSAIPAGATINSVAIEVQEQVTSGGTLRTVIAVVGVDGDLNDNIADTALTVRTYSNLNRPGGGGWTRADLLDGTLTVRFEGRQPNNTTSRTYLADYVKVIVDYTPVIVDTLSNQETSSPSLTSEATSEDRSSSGSGSSVAAAEGTAEPIQNSAQSLQRVLDIEIFSPDSASTQTIAEEVTSGFAGEQDTLDTQADASQSLTAERITETFDSSATATPNLDAVAADVEQQTGTATITTADAIAESPPQNTGAASQTLSEAIAETSDVSATAMPNLDALAAEAEQQQGTVTLTTAEAIAETLSNSATAAVTAGEAIAESPQSVAFRYFGRKDATSGGATSPDANDKIATKFTLASAETITKLGFRGQTPVRQSFRLALYSHNAGSDWPAAVLAQTPNVSLPTSIVSNYDFDVVTPVALAAGTYWVGTHTGFVSGSASNLYEDGGRSVTSFDNDLFADGTSSPWSASEGSSIASTFSFWAEVGRETVAEQIAETIDNVSAATPNLDALAAETDSQQATSTPTAAEAIAEFSDTSATGTPNLDSAAAETEQQSGAATLTMAEAVAETTSSTATSTPSLSEAIAETSQNSQTAIPNLDAAAAEADQQTGTATTTLSEAIAEQTDVVATNSPNLDAFTAEAEEQAGTSSHNLAEAIAEDPLAVFVGSNTLTDQHAEDYVATASATQSHGLDATYDVLPRFTIEYEDSGWV